jgi:hypothetical protein
LVDIQVTEDDLSALLRTKVNQITNLELQLACVSRVLSERDTRIEELETKLNGKGGHDEP